MQGLQRAGRGSRANPQQREAQQGSCSSLSGFPGRAQKRARQWQLSLLYIHTALMPAFEKAKAGGWPWFGFVVSLGDRLRPHLINKLLREIEISKQGMGWLSWYGPCCTDSWLPCEELDVRRRQAIPVLLDTGEPLACQASLSDESQAPVSNAT
jgi:hypothetical protein